MKPGDFVWVVFHPASHYVAVYEKKFLALFHGGHFAEKVVDKRLGATSGMLCAHEPEYKEREVDDVAVFFEMWDCDGCRCEEEDVIVEKVRLG